jgi:hypothetical protein
VQEANVTPEYEKGLPETCEPIRELQTNRVTKKASANLIPIEN